MKLYVPNPQMWVNFFEKLSSGKTINQSGRGSRPCVMSVEQSKSSDNKMMAIKTVLPAEQTTAQAKSELKREGINPESVNNVIQTFNARQRRGIKRKNTSSEITDQRYKSTKIGVIGEEDIFKN